MDQLMNGSNPKADAELAAAIGCKLSDEVPPVILGNRGYETDAAGESLEKQLAGLASFVRESTTNIVRAETILAVRRIILAEQMRCLAEPNWSVHAALTRAMCAIEEIK